MKTEEREKDGKDVWTYKVYATEGQPADKKGYLIDVEGKNVIATVKKPAEAYMVAETRGDIDSLYPTFDALWGDVKRGRDIRLREESKPEDCTKAKTGRIKSTPELKAIQKHSIEEQRLTADYLEGKITLEQLGQAMAGLKKDENIARSLDTPLS